MTHDKARNKVNSAIKTGAIIKPSHCSECLELTPSRQLHAHHDDYEQPLEVRWLCTSCHVNEHFPHRTGMPRQPRGDVGAVRLHKDYADKLRKISEAQKRSMSRMLEVLVDEALEQVK